MISILSFALGITLIRRDTTVILGRAARDLTGDGKPEVLTLVGVGPSIDSLDLTFSIESSGQAIYRVHLQPLSRASYVKNNLQSRLRMDYQAWLRDVGQSFFASAKFNRPSEFLAAMRQSIPGHISEIPAIIARNGGFPADSARGAAIWREIQRTNVTIFDFSPGGDVVQAIAWSIRDRRFYNLLECC